MAEKPHDKLSPRTRGGWQKSHTINSPLEPPSCSHVLELYCVCQSDQSGFSNRDSNHLCLAVCKFKTKTLYFKVGPGPDTVPI